MGKAARIGIGHHVRDDDSGAFRQGFPHEAGVGHGNCRIGGHHPEKLDAAIVNRAEQVHCFQTRA